MRLRGIKVPTFLIGEIAAGRLHRNAIATYCAIARHSGKATQAQIAAETHQSVRSVREHTRQLTKLGVLP